MNSEISSKNVKPSKSKIDVLINRNVKEEENTLFKFPPENRTLFSCLVNRKNAVSIPNEPAIVSRPAYAYISAITAYSEGINKIV